MRERHVLTRAPNSRFSIGRVFSLRTAATVASLPSFPAERRSKTYEGKRYDPLPFPFFFGWGSLATATQERERNVKRRQETRARTRSQTRDWHCFQSSQASLPHAFEVAGPKPNVRGRSRTATCTNPGLFRWAGWLQFRRGDLDALRREEHRAWRQAWDFPGNRVRLFLLIIGDLIQPGLQEQVHFGQFCPPKRLLVQGGDTSSWGWRPKTTVSLQSLQVPTSRLEIRYPIFQKA